MSTSRIWNRRFPLASKAGSQPKTYRNYKDLLADKRRAGGADCDAGTLALPDGAGRARGGKRFYVEKPLCQTPEQGVALVEAEKKRKVRDSGGHAAAELRSLSGGAKDCGIGHVGQVRMVRSWWLNNYLGTAPATKLEGKLDWEQWQGPAEHRAFDPNRFRNWRQYSDYAGGIVADQGAHVFDGIHLLMNAGYPVAVTSSAGRKPHKAGVDTPESVVAIAEYPEDFLAVSPLTTQRCSTNRVTIN